MPQQQPLLLTLRVAVFSQFLQLQASLLVGEDMLLLRLNVGATIKLFFCLPFIVGEGDAGRSPTERRGMPMATGQQCRPMTIDTQPHIIPDEQPPRHPCGEKKISENYQDEASASGANEM